MHKENETLIHTLKDCSMECNNCYNACLQEEDIKMMVKCIRLDRNCADICDMTASWLASGSELSDKLKKLCSEVCDACAEECEKHSHEHCKRCAEMCRKCSEACKS